MSVLRGEAHGMAKLTDADVAVVHAALADDPNVSPAKLAKRLGVSASTIGGIIAGRYWKHLPMDPPDRALWAAQWGEKHHQAKLTAEKVRAVRAAHARGWTQRQLAAWMGVALGTINKVVHRETWKHVE